MEFWEFLIQKEGDRSWLPLESPDVEVLEGRYRVVARSSRVNVPVEIRIIHAIEQDGVPKRRVQKRHSKTNEDGLVVVMPYTRLQSGRWELICAGDLMDDMLGQGWRHTVQLQVLPLEDDVSEVWDLGDDDDGKVASTPEAARSPHREKPPVEPVATAEAAESLTPPVPAPTVAASSQALVQQMSEQILDAVMQGFDFPAEGASQTADSAEVASGEVESAEGMPSTDVAQPAQAQPLAAQSRGQSPSAGLAVEPAAEDTNAIQITLEQDYIAARRGHPLIIRGLLQTVLSEGDALLPPAELRIWVRDPQTAEVVFETQRSLLAGPLPYAFELAIALPDTVETRLLLGELKLVAAASPESAIASCGFTLTTDLDELLEAIANDFSPDVQPPLDFVDQGEAPLDLAFLNLLTTPQPIVTLQPALGQVLPPQIYQPDATRSKPKSVELPFGGNATVLEESAQADEGIQAAERTEAIPETGSEDATVAAEAEASSPDLEPAVRQPRETVPETLYDPADAPIELAAVLDGGDRPVPRSPEPSLAPEDIAFRSLNLQHRFLSRLFSLAADREWVSRLEPQATPADALNGGSPPAIGSPLADAEIVLEEDVPPPPLRSSLYQPARKPFQPDAPILPTDESVPQPQLQIPTGELTAGKRIDVLVKLPVTPYRFYVRLWLHDRQTRAILDGPRWLMNFAPNAHGELETWTQMTVPFGCLEVQFEAIAIEIATQRESHKVVIERDIVPPDLPTLSMEDLGI